MRLRGDSDVGSFVFSSISKADGATFLGVTMSVLKRLIGIDMNLELLEIENKSRVISTPKVITQNKKAASIVSTKSAHYLTRTEEEGGKLTKVFTEISAPLSLTVTPQVTNEGSIIMEVNIQKDALHVTEDTTTRGAPPDKVSNSINTSVLVDNGSTIVIGGVYSFLTNDNVSGIPFLKDIPLIGWLFRSAYRPVEDRQELIIFLTPRIINEEDAGLQAETPNETPRS